MIVRSAERVKETGEVFTPRELVDLVLDKLPPGIWVDPNRTWLEPSCGDGNFLVAIAERLMETLKSWQPDDQQRHRHIIEQQLFGVDLMQDNVDACIDRLNARHLKHNIVCADGLEYDYSFGRPTELGEGLILESEDPGKAKARKEAEYKPVEVSEPEMPKDLWD